MNRGWLPSGLTVDTSPFTLGPYLVTPNATSIDFTFFTITAPANYTGPFGLLPATITILGDTSFEEITTTATNPLGDRNFNLSVQAASVSAPEPATWLSFVLDCCLRLVHVWQGAVCGISRCTKANDPTDN